MIGNPKWFGRRKYTGWGLTPTTWQGWVYILISVIIVFAINNLTVEGEVRMLLMFIWVVILGIDVIDMMIHLNKDEREKMHEALAERNATWVMITVLGIAIAYQAASSVVTKNIQAVDPFIFVALFSGLIAKAVTNFYLRNK